MHLIPNYDIFIVQEAIMDSEERRTYNKNYQKTNRKMLNARERLYERRLWREAIEGYGGRCQCCQEGILRFLTIDHINGERPEFRDLKPTKGKNRAPAKTLYLWLKRNNFPPGFRVLCWNCNQATRWGEECPHKIPNSLQQKF